MAYNSLINVIPHATAIDKDNVYEIVSQYDIVLLAVNNPQTAMLVNEACVDLDKPFVYGKTNGFIGTAGFILPHETPCLACFYGEEIPPEDNYGSVSGVSSTIASLMSTSVLQYLLGAPVAMKGKLFIYNCENATIDKIASSPPMKMSTSWSSIPKFTPTPADRPPSPPVPVLSRSSQLPVRP